MAFEVVKLLGDMFYGIFGNGLIFAGVLLAVLFVIMVTLRANVVVVALVVIPLMTGFILNVMANQSLYLPTWTILIPFFILGLGLMVLFFRPIVSGR